MSFLNKCTFKSLVNRVLIRTHLLILSCLVPFVASPRSCNASISSLLVMVLVSKVSSTFI